MYTFLFLSVSCLLSVASACFIINCPIGGKRSAIEDKTLMANRQCSTCGPRGAGRCFGPGICCGPEIGCRMSMSDNAVCQLEDAFPVPCINEGAPCGQSINGKCAAEGICCSTDQCIMDETCKPSMPTHRRKGSNSLSSNNLMDMLKGENSHSFA